MITDSNITIFNRRRNDEGDEVLQPTFIKRCTWFYAHIVAGSQMMDNADEYSVRIPIDADFEGRSYLPAHQYEELEDDASKAYWTIQKNDIVVRGEYHDTIGDQMQIATQTDDIFIVSTFANNTIRGSRKVKHWRVGGS